MPKNDFDADSYVRQTAALLDIPLPDDLVDGVAHHLLIAAGLAAQIMSLPLEPTDEPLPRFEP